MMARDSIRENLLLTPFVQAVSNDMRERIAMIIWWIGMVEIDAPGTALLDDGENDGAILLNGQVRVEADGKDPINVEAPNLFGEMKQFMPDSTRTASVVADTECIVLRFMWDDLVRLSMRYLTQAEQAAMKTAILDGATERLRELYENAERDTQA